tara:strand:- start:3922 stop:4419 length:498 start_codon:yes stop_codon:yes gene_type:complete
MHGAVILSLVLPVYVCVSFVATQQALKHPVVHDLVYVYSEWADVGVHVALVLAMLLSLATRPDWDLLCRRLAAMGMLKALVQIVTIVPSPDVDYCRGAPIWTLRACADMMFSGHTAFTYLVLYRCKYRNLLTFFMAFELVMGDWHYTSDTIMAVITGYAIEQYLK